jgi:N-acetylmuramoyl-L-alanine amidase
MVPTGATPATGRVRAPLPTASLGRVPGSPLTRALVTAALLVALAAPLAAGAPAGAPRPRIVSKPIPFPAKRKTEMQAYAKRHYGLPTWRLRNPKVIVEHVTVSTTFASAYSTFAADVPDSELHELPGTCAHFVVDTDGTIYQLVPLEIMCRHTVGLNWTAIGIEHVGMSDADVLSNPRQMAASLALSAWLMSRYGIGIGDVIGHNESLTSRFRHERYAGWRCQTHGDWTKNDMGVYRVELTAVARRAGVPLGGAVRHVTPNC